jgi:hypothetical protein
MIKRLYLNIGKREILVDVVLLLDMFNKKEKDELQYVVLCVHFVMIFNILHKYDND